MDSNVSKPLIRVGIFFGGSSREREISFVGGRTVYDRLDRSLFEPIPIFVDSSNNFILLNWEHLYKGTIRDFYPGLIVGNTFSEEYIESFENLSKQEQENIIEKVGTRIYPHSFNEIIDFAFLCLHGDKGEDGSIQGILEWYKIPYSGTHILGSAINVDKGVQKDIIMQCGVYDDIPEKFRNDYRLSFSKWQNIDRKSLYDNIRTKVGLPFVVKSCRQGSSIGVKVVRGYEDFENSVNSSFFILKITANFWNSLSLKSKNKFISTQIVDVRYGIGMPLLVKNIYGFNLKMFLKSRNAVSKTTISQITSSILGIDIPAPFEDVSKKCHHSIKNNDISNNSICTGYSNYTTIYSASELLKYLNATITDSPITQEPSSKNNEKLDFKTMPFTEETITDGPITQEPSSKNNEKLDFKTKTFSEKHLEKNKDILLISKNHEREVLFEPYIEGREFSCIVLEDSNGNPCVLPPTELTQKDTMPSTRVLEKWKQCIASNDPNFDYRKKYMPGITNKITPMDISFEQFLKIEDKCKTIFKKLHCKVYARIDGFLTKEGHIILNDPNTTSGMNPASFLFNQCAEIGFDPTYLLTYVIRSSLKSVDSFISNSMLDKKNDETKDSFLSKKQIDLKAKKKTQKIGILMGGVSSERHISMESGRNIYDKLASSVEYEPIPIFFTTTKNGDHKLFIIPVNIMLKENADDIRQYILDNNQNSSIAKLYKDINQSVVNDTVLTSLKNNFSSNQNAEKILHYVRKNFGVEKDYSVIEITYDTLKKYVDFIFIALHGRPGEDGQVQAILEKHDIPYNGSGIQTCKTTINKYRNNQLLKKHHIMIASQVLVKKIDWLQNPNKIISEIENNIKYPMIGKPNDDGCSTDIKKIHDNIDLKNYMCYMFESSSKHRVLKTPKSIDTNSSKIDKKESCNNNGNSPKQEVLIEKYILENKCSKVIEITGGLLTKNEDVKLFEKEKEILPHKNIQYTIFEPSQVIKSLEVLSLEEKFLAGEGQNITPVIYYENAEFNRSVSCKVKEEFLKVAKILNLEGYARIDAFVKFPNITKDVQQLNYILSNLEILIIEVNTLPAMTPATCIFHQAAVAGYKPLDFIQSIIKYGMVNKLRNRKPNNVLK